LRRDASTSTCESSGLADLLAGWALCASTARRGSSVKVALWATLDPWRRIARAPCPRRHGGLEPTRSVADDVLLGKARRSRTRQGRLWKR
jgi:hypothetical protein